MTEFVRKGKGCACIQGMAGGWGGVLGTWNRTHSVPGDSLSSGTPQVLSLPLSHLCFAKYLISPKA